MIKWKDELEQGHFDIHDLINWTESQAVRCKREDYQVIYRKFSRLLKRLKEDRRRVFDEHYGKPKKESGMKIFKQPRTQSYVEPKREPERKIPKPPRMQRFRHKIRDIVSFGYYKDLLEK